MKQKLLKLMCLLCVSVIGVSAWGETAGFTLTGSAGSTATGTISGTASETWNYSATFSSGAAASAQNQSWQVGSSSKKCTQLVLSTNGISGIITKIDVSCGAQTGKGTVNCTVGGANFGTQNQSAGSGNNPTSYGTTPSFSGSASGEIVITIKNTGTYISVKSITVTYTPSSAVNTTTTIDASGITNTDVYTGTAAGSLAASVKAGDDAVAGATVTWSGNNDAVATINASTGAVTLVGEGTVTFTASYAGVTNEYKASSDTYEMTVVDNRPYITLWSEDFSSYSSADVPDGGDFKYSATDGTSTTKIYEADIAGGTSPELLVSKNNGSFTATITDFKSCTGEFLLNFVTNKDLTVNITADGHAIETTGNVKSDRTKTTLSFTLPQGTEELVIEFTMTTNENARLDNIVLKGNTYTRSTAAGNWGTICLPYDATVAGAKLYTIVGKEITGSEVTAILLDEVASIEAGKPYIFKATADNVVATYTGTTYTAAGAVNGLYGTYSAIAAGKWDTYVSGDLYLMTTSNVQAADKTSSSLAANRAYIVLDEVNNIGSPVKGVRLGFDGTETTTGIKNLTPALSEGEGVIYNLNGQQLSAPQRGINIIGGKKVLVK